MPDEPARPCVSALAVRGERALLKQAVEHDLAVRRSAVAVVDGHVVTGL